MDKLQAIEFLKSNQPLLNDSELDLNVIHKFDDVRKFFIENHAAECIPLFLNSFGDFDGYGVYQLVEDVIRQYTLEEVIPHLKVALQNDSIPIQYWCSQIAEFFPDKRLIPELGKLSIEGDDEVKPFAMLSLSAIDDASVREIFKQVRERENNPGM